MSQPNNRATEVSAKGGVSFALLTIFFTIGMLILKWTALPTLSWWIVFLPILAYAATLTVVFVVLAILLGILATMNAVSQRR